MNAQEQATECLQAVREEIEDILRKGPLIMRVEALVAAQLMRFTSAHLMRLCAQLPVAAVAVSRTEPVNCEEDMRS